MARHERNHRALAAGIDAMGLSLLPPASERLWTLNTVRVPAGVDEAAVRKTLLTTYNIEVGAGLGPLPVARFDVACTPQLNHFQGTTNVRLKVLDWRPAV